METIRFLRPARLSVLLFVVAVGCSASGDNDEMGTSGADGGNDTGMGETEGEGGDTSNPSYTAALVISVCDNLSSASVLNIGALSHVSDYTDLPFPFPLFGKTATRFVIAEPGHIYIGGPSLFVSTAGEPQQPPNVAIPNGWVAPFWDSHLTYLPNIRGDVRVLLTGTGADERFVMGYNDFTLAFPSDMVPNPDVHLSFQVVLLRQSQAIEFRYCQLDPGPNPTQALRDRVLGSAAEIGLESADGRRGVSYSFRTPIKQAGMAIRFTPTP